ncbi:uncharacterized protein LOC134199215 [Bombyx mori]|uniref:uncharacterized protein LOC134199215 n=1 Tax=Bombyx mori TaxID=7091 RepID=UPI002ED34177
MQLKELKRHSMSYLGDGQMRKCSRSAGAPISAVRAGGVVSSFGGPVGRPPYRRGDLPGSRGLGGPRPRKSHLRLPVQTHKTFYHHANFLPQQILPATTQTTILRVPPLLHDVTLTLRKPTANTCQARTSTHFTGKTCIRQRNPNTAASPDTNAPDVLSYSKCHVMKSTVKLGNMSQNVRCDDFFVAQIFHRGNRDVITRLTYAAFTLLWRTATSILICIMFFLLYFEHVQTRHVSPDPTSDVAVVYEWNDTAGAPGLCESLLLHVLYNINIVNAVIYFNLLLFSFTFR